MSTSARTLELPRFEVSEARYSHMALMPRLFAYIDYRSIGVHENSREANTRAVYDSISEIGYKGPAISAFYSFNDEPLGNLGQNSLLALPYGMVGVADGHNRLETFRRFDEEGRLRSPIVPIQLVPAHNARYVSLFDLEHPHSEEMHALCVKCLGTLALIETCHVDQNLVVEDISTCFLAKLSDGVSVRIRAAQPDIAIAKDELLC